MSADGIARIGHGDWGIKNRLVALANVELLGLCAHKDRNRKRLAPSFSGGGNSGRFGRGGSDLLR